MQQVTDVRRGLWTVVLAAGALFISSCISSTAVQRVSEFSAATTLTTTNTKSAFTVVEAQHERRTVARMVDDFDKPGFKPSLPRPLLDEKAIAARTTILDGISAYAGKLTALMSGTQLTAFDDQTRALGQQISNLKSDPAFLKLAESNNNTDIKFGSVTIPGSAGPLKVATIPLSELAKLSGGVSKANVAELTTGIEVLGRFLIEQKLSKNIKHDVDDMQAPLAAACALLIADIGRPSPLSDSPPGTGLRDVSWRAYDELIRIQDSYIRKNRFEPVARILEIQKELSLVQEQQQADNILKATQDSLSTLIETHAALVTAFDKQSPRLQELIGQLVAQGKQARDFYQSVSRE